MFQNWVASGIQMSAKNKETMGGEYCLWRRHILAGPVLVLLVLTAIMLHSWTYRGNDVEARASEPPPIYAPVFGTARGRILSETKKQSMKKLVLVCAYMRGGSTFLGSIINAADKSFYFYEPLWKISKFSYYEKHRFCGMFDVCRTPHTDVESDNTALTVLQNAFHCRIENVTGHMDFTVTFYETYATTYQKQVLRNCNPNENKCINLFHTSCDTASVVSMKVIRLGMDVLGDLMQMLPELKVVYLLRDPRGLMSSLHGSTMTAYLSNWTTEIPMCRKMLNDLNFSKYLVQKYNERFAIIRYEDLAQAPVDLSRILYQFLGITFTAENRAQIERQTNASGITENSQGFYRNNSSQTAFKWRNDIDWNAVQKIDRFCKDIYSLSGYETALSEGILRNMSYPLIKTPTMKGILRNTLP